MGLFKRRKQQEEGSSQERLTVGQALRKERFKQGKAGVEDVTEQLTEYCVQYEEATENRLQAEHEYEAVMSYLADIQKIDDLGAEQRSEAEALAGNIIRLNEERMRFQDKEDQSISPARFLQMERYEQEVEASLKTLKEQEQYRELINRDVRNLEGEKGAILYEKEEAEIRIRFFRKLSIALVLMVCAVFIVLMYLMQKFGVVLMIPILVTGTLAMAMAAYIITSVRKLRRELAVAEAKMNRAIQLLNKVKIKLVACVNAIDYVYEKYGVSSHRELEYLWEQYYKVKVKRAEYRKNTELLERYNAALTECLQRLGLKDAEVWVYQPEAIVDAREMVEVRHHVNERRRKVKERVEAAGKNCEQAHKELKEFTLTYPQFATDMQMILDKRGIIL